MEEVSENTNMKKLTAETTTSMSSSPSSVLPYDNSLANWDDVYDDDGCYFTSSPPSKKNEAISVETEGGEDGGRIVVKVIALEERRKRLSVKESLHFPDGNKKDQRKDGSKSVFEIECVPLWGSASIRGRRPEMEDALIAVPHFMKIPIEMFVGDGFRPTVTHLDSHFFGVYDGHGGSQVANYCRDRLHSALAEELTSHKAHLTSGSSVGARRARWERIFTDCFLKVDDEVSGKRPNERVSKFDGKANDNLITVAPETVGSTAVVALVCSSHIIVSNCGDSRAVLYRGKDAIPLSADHKPSRKDEFARIESSGGKIIKWNGHRVCGVLAMSRAIGDGFLKLWIIAEPEITFLPRARDDECLILASDGLWDVMTNEEACEAARKRILLWHKRNGTTSQLVERGHRVDPAASAAAEHLCSLAIQKGSKDNISVIVVDLKPRRKAKNKKS